MTKARKNSQTTITVVGKDPKAKKVAVCYGDPDKVYWFTEIDDDTMKDGYREAPLYQYVDGVDFKATRRVTQ